MDSNFVSIVGYQLEKVHTGVIRWLLDSKNQSISFEQKYEILRRVYKVCNMSIPFSINEICNISCIPEFSFGRKRKIDLVIKIDLINSKTKYLVIEMKVDSIPYEEQLIGTYNDFIQSKKYDEDALFLLFLFGASQVCMIPDLHGFHIFRLPEILEVFSGYHIEQNVYKDWIQALRYENMRRRCIGLDINGVDNIWEEEYWKDKGYRTWFPLFYYIYNELRKTSKRFNEWNIYSGHNNPVMNWSKGWVTRYILGSKIQFYFEFNYEDFILKIMLDKNNMISKDNLNMLRKEIVKICETIIKFKGKRTSNKYGVSNSIYKWTFDFKKEGLSEVMKKVDYILDTVYPMLENFKM
ncbi:PD-(D/E)XK nuclease family protein [Caloranaerobacter sp. DY30410]|uniref:PD-(D/E)XK nuclease family protein n=1 Tax=Caloranaerobacter sp. DY30410 TaxID=3238305 RepID=UPI003D08EAF9